MMGSSETKADCSLQRVSKGINFTGKEGTMLKNLCVGPVSALQFHFQWQALILQTLMPKM